MNEMKSALALCISTLLSRLSGVVLVTASLAISSTPAFAQTGASTSPPVVSLATLDPALTPLTSAPLFAWKTSGRALEFVATASRADSSPVDVYFGILAPGGRVYSWNAGLTNVPLLFEGFVPAGRRVTDTAISSAGLLAKNPQHVFSADHPLGLYSVFFFWVPTGADPNDARQWIGATMSPLVLSN